MSEEGESSTPRMKITFSQKEILVKQVCEEGKTIAEAAQIANIKLNTAKCIISKYKRDDCEIIERPRGGKRKEKLTPEVLEKIENIVESNPAVTLKEIQNRLALDNIRITIQTIHNGLRALKITIKLARYEIDRMNSPSTLEQRKVYALDFSQNSPECREKCIFIDEAGFNLHLRRTQARSRRGSRANVLIPTVRGRNITLVAAINTEGLQHYKIISDSTCNSNKFCIFLRELVEKLEARNNMDGAWLIMDNDRIHKTGEVRAVCDRTTFQIKFLPPYSPMLNPIENAFSKIKASAKRILSDETREERRLVTIIEESLDTLTAADCNNYVMNMMVKLPPAATGQRIS